MKLKFSHCHPQFSLVSSTHILNGYMLVWNTTSGMLQQLNLDIEVGSNNEPIDRTLEMTSDGPTNAGKLDSSKLSVCISSDTQMIKSSDWPKRCCALWHNINSWIILDQTSFQMVCQTGCWSSILHYFALSTLRNKVTLYIWQVIFYPC